MTSRLFRVDMSEGSRDFMAVATEPGLAMLDSTGANYAILRRWLGILVAEPELQTAELVSFYVRDPQRGRLENVVCQPVTQKDLRGALKEQLEALAAGIRKAKPESANERLLHKIAAKTLKEQTADLDKSDFDCYFFKYRQRGGPWQLVWCWGYQRRDHEPSRAVICSNPDCHQLFAHRPQTKRRCPACQTFVLRKRRNLFSGAGLASLLLLLLIAALLLALLYPPRLVVEPGQWTGPAGSRVDFRVAEKKWLIFSRNVTNEVAAQSDEPRVLEFDPNGTLGRAKAPGRTHVSFRLGDKVADVAVDVTAARPPQSLKIEPAAVRVGVAATVPLKVTGTFSDGTSADLTDAVQWKVGDSKLAFVRNGRIEGAAAGKTTLTASCPGSDAGQSVDASADVEVVATDYTSIEVKLAPAEMGVGQHLRVDVTGRDSAGNVHDLSGSSRLTLSVDPPTAASLDGEYLVGQEPGKAKVVAVLDKLTQSQDFTVKESAAAGPLSVKPPELVMVVGEYRDLDLGTANLAEVKGESSDPNVVILFNDRTISAHGPGKAEVTFTRGTQHQSVKVTVKPANFTKVEVRPPATAVAVGETKKFDVVGITAEGDAVPLAPDQLKWVRQPSDRQVELLRDTLSLKGVAATTAPLEFEVQYSNLPAALGSVIVSAGPEAAGEFVPYPPLIAGAGTMVDLGPQLGGAMKLLPDEGLLVNKDLDALPGVVPGSKITSIEGNDITGMTGSQLKDYVAGHPLANGTKLGITGPDGVPREMRLGVTGAHVSQLQVTKVDPSNVTPTSFDAAVRIRVTDKANYRIVDAAGKALSQSSPLEAGTEATINIAQVPRIAGRMNYDMYVERQTAGNVIRYPFTITLTSGETSPK